MIKPNIFRFFRVELKMTACLLKERIYEGKGNSKFIVEDTLGNRCVKGFAAVTLLIFLKGIQSLSNWNSYIRIFLFVFGSFIIFNSLVWVFSRFKKL
jgi:hypothetical protein